MKLNKLAIAVFTAFVISSIGTLPADAASKWPKCSVVNATYPGGVAKSKTAKNLKTVSGKKVLATSKYKPAVSAAVYAQMKSLDRDADGIACEK